MKSILHYPSWLIAIVSGGIVGLAYHPIHLGFLAWFGFIPLIHIWTIHSPNNNARTGIIFGMTHNLISYYWIGFNSGASFGVVLLSLIGAVIYLSLYWGIAGWIYGKVKTPQFQLIIFPFLIVSMEWIRSFGAMGFPWGNLALSQLDFLPIIQIMDVAGSYGVTVLVVLFNVLLYVMILENNYNIKRIILIVSSFVILWLYGTVTIDKYSSSQQTLEVAILQPNIDPTLKWDYSLKNETIAYMDSLHKVAIGLNPDLILFPETALPAYLKLNRKVRKMIQSRVDSSNMPVLTGTVDRVKSQDGEKFYFNSSMLLSPQKTFILYNKIHLVPFAEYIPFSAEFPSLKELNFGQGNFTQGEDYTVFNWNNFSFSNLICYESSIPSVVRQFVRHGADFLTIQTNDGWLGKSAGPYQHYNIARLRAIENRIPIVRSANTGISGLILASGLSVSQKPLETTHVFKVSVPIGHSGSFYSKYGDVFAIICFVIFILLGSVSCYRKQY